MPTASWKARPPTQLQKGGGTVSPYNRDITLFVDACETLLNVDIGLTKLTVKEDQIIQYYIAALAAKFPALLK